MSVERPEEPDRPLVRASDAEREVTVARLQAAVGEGRLDLDEFGTRAEAAYSATTTAELAALLTDLPPAEVVGRTTGGVTSQPLSTVFGDVKLTVTDGVPGRVNGVFGDIKLDLRGLRTAADTVHLQLGTVFGDVVVTVSEGVAAELDGWTVFGDRKTELAAVPRLAGTPRVLVSARTVFGDIKLRSLPPGESPNRWRSLLDRLGRRGPLPPSAPPSAPPPLP